MPKDVALLIETSNRYGREIVLGAYDFARECGTWTVHVSEHGRNEFGRDWQHAACCDGVIIRIETNANAEKARRLNRPIVNVSSLGLMPEFVNFVADSMAIGRLAGQHLTERGFSNLAFIGLKDVPWSDQRQTGFLGYLREAGLDGEIFLFSSRDLQQWDRERASLTRWLSHLPRPVGIMVGTDSIGQYLLQVCHDHGLRVPDDVAVIGVNNDELFCESCTPPMSSVILNGRQAGYEAASALNDIMNGKHVPPGVRAVAPVGVATRPSTDFTAVADDQVAAAVRYIREHACRGISVDDVVTAAHLSRSALERRFRKVLNCTLHDQIQKVRIMHVQTMLIQTKLSLKEIAFRTGFEHPEYLTVAFKRLTGLPPSEFRRLGGLPSGCDTAAQ
ncbi:MAG TPA: DNA-binding transcriptional regulator [Planctomicrobium sp.]|nr:DNA-binding transcriptional regulator [Planctomicrobium sp.]